MRGGSAAEDFVGDIKSGEVRHSCFILSERCACAVFKIVFDSGSERRLIRPRGAGTWSSCSAISSAGEAPGRLCLSCDRRSWNSLKLCKAHAAVVGPSPDRGTGLHLLRCSFISYVSEEGENFSNDF
jgi:hypothetical protein